MTSIIIRHLRLAIQKVECINRTLFFDKVMEQVRKDLCSYVEKRITSGLPAFEDTLDGMVDNILPNSESVQKIVNDILNSMMEEIVKEIDTYLETNE